MEIKDSGARREFESGAVRDIDEMKGRCDLLPLDEVEILLGMDFGQHEDVNPGVLGYINSFLRGGSISALFCAIAEFAFECGWDLPTAVLEVSIHYKNGAEKYLPRNWEKGIPVHCYIDSAVRHYLKWKRGDNDEPHNRAVIWNLISCIWTIRNCPACIDTWDALKN